jgi:ketosteroid isomerase-like protein
VEIYGTESKDEIAEIASADELELSQLLEETETDESSVSISNENNLPIDEVQMNTVEATILSYERTYRNKDLDSLMLTISPEYSRDGETYRQLESKMQNLFQSYEEIDFTLQGLEVEQTSQYAKVEANYFLELKDSAGQASSYSGKLFFDLSNTNGDWRITQINTKR